PPPATSTLVPYTTLFRSVVISDKTRPVPNGVVLPPILETLERAGIPRERIEIVVGTGLHRANTREELVEMTSAAIVADYRIRNRSEEHTSELQSLAYLVC